jgi:outer membrane protein TolC
MTLTKLLNKYVDIKKLSMIATCAILPLTIYAQLEKSITLDSLQTMVKKRYPYAKQLMLNGQYGQESVKSIGSNWLPQFSISGKTTLQSEVTAISLPANVNLGFSLETGEKYQYQGELDFTQLIYDGGISNAAKEISKLASDIQAGNIETSMLQVEGIINTLFESILLTREQISMLNFQKNDLTARQKDLMAAVRNGIALQSVLLELGAEITSLEQRKIEANAQLISFYSQLSFFTQEKIDTSIVLQWPASVMESGNDFTKRPDYRGFEKQLQYSDWQLKLLHKKEFPYLALFANGYYGRPGLNALNYNDHFSGIAGISLKWNISNFYDNSHEKKKISIQQSLVQNQQILFEIEMNKQFDQLNIDIVKNKELIEKDDEVVQVRSEVKKVAAVQLENGSITLTDYLAKLNAESQAIANRNVHKIRLQMGFVKKTTLTNKNNTSNNK